METEDEIRRLRSIGIPDYVSNAKTGRIEWCADWAHLSDCIAAGLVNARSVSAGPGTYGHTDWYVPVSVQPVDVVMGRWSNDA